MTDDRAGLSAEDFADTITHGEPVALRAERGHTRTVVAGDVIVNNGPRGIATIRDGYTWHWHTGDHTPIPCRHIDHHDRGEPQKQENYRYRPRVDRDENGTVQLVVFSAVWDGHGLRYYAPQIAGEITSVRTGALVEPKQLLSDALDRRGEVVV